MGQESYNGLLDEVYKEMPEAALNKERFEVPKVTGHIQGNKTVISNFYQIANMVRRQPEHILKYISKELATPGELTKSALLLGAKVAASKINEKIKQYVREFVICEECGKPDTKITKKDGLTQMSCMACGSKRVIRARI